MERRSKITYTMIETAIDKGIRDIKDNSNRGIRNLIDLGTHFSTGPFQKEFFIMAQQMLNNDDSPYFELVNEIFQNTDPWILKRFGINLGYNSWTYGAEKIKEFKDNNGYNVPWAFIFDFIHNTNDILSIKELEDILNIGEFMGIYCGMFFANINNEQLKTLLNMLKFHKSSSYFVFLKPDMITDGIAKVLIDAGNIVPMLALDIHNYKICRNAADILLKNKCLYGIYNMCSDFNLEYLICDEYLRQVEVLRCAFAFYIKQNLNETENKERFSKFIQTSKSAIKYPFFIFDFYEDYTAISRIISTKEFFFIIKSNGSIEISLEDTLDRGFSVKKQSLNSILKAI